ncbi:MAG: MMPL family transporter [Clostridiales bacterium]|nr:MMPL family transporter [Clostridiales bacterium]
MQKIARFIVNKYPLFFVIFALMLAYCVYGITRITVEYDISKYLPADTDTAQALVIMDEEFAAYGSATVLVSDIDGSTADEIAKKIGAVSGVSGFSFDSSSASNYKDGNALYSMYFEGGSGDEKAVAAYNAVIKIIEDSGKPFCVPTPLVSNYADTLASEMVVIIAIAAAVIILVLLFTSKSFAEVIAFPFVFVIAAALNMGTNHWLGTISFVSNTVCIILQLALAIDYAIILCHRFTEEKDKNPSDPKAALTTALAKAIPEIASSSLTTISGLVALMFMQLGLGFDLGMVLAKSIVCSLVTVFLFMPGVLLILSKLMDKSRHRNFVPKIRRLGKIDIKLRYVLLAAFVVLFGVGAGLSTNLDYCYSTNSIDTSRPSAQMQAQNKADEIFGASNAFVILVPDTVSYEVQREITEVVQQEELITSALGWASIGLPSKSDPDKMYYLTDSITPLGLSDAIGIEPDKAGTLFMLYAMNRGKPISGSIYDCEAPIVDLLDFAFTDSRVSAMAGDMIGAYKDTLEFGKAQLLGENHTRIVFTVGAALESAETFALIERLTPTVKNICPEAIFAGSSMSAYDLNKSFSHDNILITVLTIAFIYLILAFTFRSWGIPIVLVLVIQGAIFMNFAIPVIVGRNMFFFVYLIASAIQMGATIDYAILMTNRFRALSSRMPRDRAVTEAISQSFPTIITSGTIMTVASFLVGFLTSDPLISSMGITLGLGTIISIVCVLTVLPAALYVFGPLLEKTVIKGKPKAKNIRMPNPSLPPSADE